MRFPKPLLTSKQRQAYHKTGYSGKTTSHQFYRRAAWRRFRKAYIDTLEAKQTGTIPELRIEEVMKVYLLDSIPVCEECLRMYVMGTFPGVQKGNQLDHITPVNPIDPMHTLEIYGEPLDPDNVQLLCHRCHSEKSAGDKQFHNNIKT